MKDFLRAMFGASGREVNGVIVLVLVFLLTMLIPLGSRIFSSGMQPVSENDARTLDSLVLLMRPTVDSVDSYENFKFNPNLVSRVELNKLGFREQAVEQILNYRKAGGKFRDKADLLKIYAIDSMRVVQLNDYIDIPTPVKQKTGGVAQLVTETESNNRSVAKVKAASEMEKFNLNIADTSMLQIIKGIGPVLSKRIVAFRSSLGGFAELNQLYEVYNLDSAIVEELLKIAYIPEPAELSKVNVNRLDEEGLATHPYISRKQARLIIAYRNQHGNFNSLQDLLEVYLINESDIRKLAAYISFEVEE